MIPSHYLYLNTRDRDEGANNDAVFNIDKRTLPSQFVMTLESIQFPHHMYPLSAERGNTTVYFQEDGDSNTTFTAIPELNRNYNGTTLATELSAKLTAVSGGGKTYTVAYDNDSKRFTISVNAGTFRLVSGTLNMNSELGFDDRDEAFAGSITLRNPVDLSGTKYVDVVSTLGGNLNYVTSGSYTVIARMPTLASFGEVVLYEPSIRHSVSGVSNTPTMRISLRDDRGNLVQLGTNGYVSYAFQITPFLGESRARPGILPK